MEKQSHKICNVTNNNDYDDKKGLSLKKSPRYYYT